MASSQLKRTFFRSKLARRILLMFVACTLLPIAALFVISFRQVTRQLDIQSQKHLNQSVEAHGSMIRERLLFLETDLRIIASMLSDNGELQLDVDHFERLKRRFNAIVLSSPSGSPHPILGDGFEQSKLNDAEWSHIRAGNTVIQSRTGRGKWPRLLMIRLIRPHNQPPISTGSRNRARIPVDQLGTKRPSG